jgi:hypothetical protein
MSDMGNVSNNEKLKKILYSHFKTGFRVESPIELTRLRRFAVESWGLTVELTDEELTSAIKTVGVFFDKKVYVIPSETTRKISVIIEELFSDGVSLIFYEKFYELNEKWLFDGSIISCEMLKSILENLFPAYSYKKNYFTNNVQSKPELQRIHSEISRVWGDVILLNYSSFAS